MSLLNSVFGAGAQQALMGTSLEDSVLDHRAQQYNTAISQAMLANERMRISAQGNIGIGTQATQRPIKPFNPNEDAAYTTPLSQLVTLWQAKYGDEWVEVFDDDFWNSARVRLNNNEKLEGVGGWYRIKEDA